MVHVPFNNNQLFADLLSGTVSLRFYPYLVLKQHIETGALIPLATTGSTRSPWLPQLPTMVELGYPTIVFTSWFGLHGPAGLPADVTNAVAQAARRSMAAWRIRLCSAPCPTPPRAANAATRKTWRATRRPRSNATGRSSRRPAGGSDSAISAAGGERERAHRPALGGARTV